MRLLRTCVLLIAISFIAGCASQESATMGREENDANNQAYGGAYLVDAMNIRTPMQARPDWKPWKFYYKTCEENGKGTYYSKTSYTCTDAYY